MSPFLRLPGEIRNQIYGYLLSTEYTKYPPTEEDPEWEYNGNRYRHIARPTHRYHFHVGILLTNRQINHEGSSVLYDRNMFVELRSQLREREVDFAWLGVPIIAQGAAASRFVHTVLRIEVDPKRIRYPKEAPLQLIFAANDLPAFCKAVAFGGRLLDPIVHKAVSINLNCSAAAEQAINLACPTTRQLKSLLEPFRLLHSFRFAHIIGPLDEQYKKDLCLSICKMTPSFEESLSEVLDKVKEGDNFFNARGASRYLQAIEIYNAAMTDLKNRCCRIRPLSSALPSATGIDLRVVYVHLIFKLRFNLAYAHFQTGQYWQTRKWTKRVMDAGYYEPTITRYQNHPHYLKACVMNAHSNRKLARWDEVIEAVDEAVRITPHAEAKLSFLREEEREYREKMAQTVKMVLENSRMEIGGCRVIRYPADFEEVKSTLARDGEWWVSRD